MLLLQVAGSACISTTKITDVRRDGIVCHDAEWLKVDDTDIFGRRAEDLVTCGIKVTGSLADCAARPNHHIQHTTVAKCATGMACEGSSARAVKLTVQECIVGVRVAAAACHLFQADIRDCICKGVHVCFFLLVPLMYLTFNMAMHSLLAVHDVID